MRRLKLTLVLIVSIIISSCGGGSTSGGVGTSTSGFYRGTIEYSGYNTCGLNVPGSGRFQITITSSGDVTFDPIGLSWMGGRYGRATFRSAINGAKIKSSYIGRDSGYSYDIDGRIRDEGRTISGTGSISGSYGSCEEKFVGVFAGVLVN